MKNIVIGFLLLSDLIVMGHVVYLKQTTSVDVKAKCQQEKIDYAYENQYIDYLARQGR
jgi:Mn2+/Fe2+ NRAMP family transporter